MSSKSNTNQVIFDVIQEGVQRGILHLNTDGDRIEGMHIMIHGKNVLNFSSCSYLGLEHHPALKAGATAAIEAFGTQFSASRAYISLGLYEKLEEALSLIFQEKNVIVTPTTTLGHIAAIPVLAEDGDAVILDHQVHHSVQTAAGLLRSKKVHIELIRHNNMPVLEDRIKELKKRYNKIWYLADGVYSMYGDFCPLKEVQELLDNYEQFRLYIDDAHGMSYFGKNGSGFVCSRMNLHPQMVLGTSLNKAFASGGGAFIFPDEELFRKVRTCGSTLITSGPLQPANLGAALAAAQIHLSSEIYDLQDSLHDKIKFTHLMLANHELPVISDSGAAIFFVGVSLPKLGYKIVEQMLERGYYLNLGIFPAVPIKNTGIRFTITHLHTYKQISDMVTALKEEFDAALRSENVAIEQVYKAFKKETPAAKKALDTTNDILKTADAGLQVLHYETIKEIKTDCWNRMFEGKGAFDWNGLVLLEKAFSSNQLPEDNWDFDYLLVKDKQGNDVAATFITSALWKDDMLSPAEISVAIEEQRRKDPYHLVSKMTATGSLITEGEHLYINREHPEWKYALTLLLNKIHECHLHRKSAGVILRDFASPDADITAAITGNGYFKSSMPDSYVVIGKKNRTGQELYETLNRKNKKNFRADISAYMYDYEVEIAQSPAPGQVQEWYNMYMEVRKRNLDINTFPLPLRLFELMVMEPGWEVLVLKLKETGKTVSVIFSYKSGDTYVPTIIGMDYGCLISHKVYKQSLFRLLVRAAALGCERINLGFGAELEKRKLNALPVETFSFVHLEDSFNTEFIRNYKAVTS